LLLCTIKPFCAAIWVAVSHGPDSSRGPPNTVWSKQIQSVLQWTTACFEEAMPDLQCISTVVACLGHGPQAKLGGSPHREALAHGSVSTVYGPRGYPHRAPGQQVLQAVGALFTPRTGENLWKMEEVLVLCGETTSRCCGLWSPYVQKGWRVAMFGARAGVEYSVGRVHAWYRGTFTRQCTRNRRQTQFLFLYA